MKKIIYISAILLFVFAVYGKAQAEDGKSKSDLWRVNTSTGGSLNNQWSTGGDEGDNNESEGNARIRANVTAQPNLIRAHDDENDTEDNIGDDNEIDSSSNTSTSDDVNDDQGEHDGKGFKLFPLFPGLKHEGALDQIQKQETQTGAADGTHSPFLKDNKGESDNRSPRAEFRMKIGMRFTFAMHNLDNLRTRLSTHIDFLKTKGANVTTATTLLATADADIANAKTAVDALQAKIDAVMAPLVPTVTANIADAVTVTPPALDDATKAEIRALATTAKDAIVKAYKSLGAVIDELKKLHQENKIDDQDTTATTAVTAQ